MSFPFVVPRLVSVSRRVVPCRVVFRRVLLRVFVKQAFSFFRLREREREGDEEGTREKREERKKERREYFRLSFSCSLVVAEPQKDLDKLLALVRQRSSA